MRVGSVRSLLERPSDVDKPGPGLADKVSFEVK